MYQEEPIEQTVRKNKTENAVVEPGLEYELPTSVRPDNEVQQGVRPELIVKPGPTIKIKTVKKKPPIN